MKESQPFLTETDTASQANNIKAWSHHLWGGEGGILVFELAILFFNSRKKKQNY